MSIRSRTDITEAVVTLKIEIIPKNKGTDDTLHFRRDEKYTKTMPKYGT